MNNIRDCLAAAKKGIDAVSHIAAWPTPTDQQSRYPDRYDDPDFFPQTMQTNVMGTYNMLQAAVRADIGVFVLTGSNCVLGHVNRVSSRPLPLYYLPVDEVHPGEVEDSYSLSKLIDEEILKMFTRSYGIRAASIRSGWILDEALRRAWAGKVKPSEHIFQNFNAYIAAEDEAVFTRCLLEQAPKLPLYAEYYCNADDSLALEPTMELIERYRADLIPKLKTALPKHSSFISNLKLKNATGYTPQFTWREFL